MAELKCKADTCTYYKDECCCKGDIMVGGKHACESQGTCCESFVKRRGDSLTSAAGHPSVTVSVDCEAVKCMYNANYKCMAQSVEIKGSGADNSHGTCCKTFREK
ncbi:MAG: DUF1540 domain-containing protein [Lachnospiraceae bacterium]|nr:DUF1540 domain-containing protein [Lachnospiraceae bacterium]